MLQFYMFHFLFSHQFWNPDNPAQVLGFKFPFRVSPTLSSSRERLKSLMDPWKAATDELRMEIDFTGALDPDRTGRFLLI